MPRDTTGEIAAHFDELYEAKISPDTISRITDKIIADMADWVSRPLESIYAAIFIDALSVKVRDGQVANRPFYAAIGVDLAGHKDVLGLWAGDGPGIVGIFPRAKPALACVFCPTSDPRMAGPSYARVVTRKSDDGGRAFLRAPKVAVELGLSCARQDDRS
jgi:hypothetical protein